MKSRRERLKKLVDIQLQLKAVHDMRRAGHLHAARAAGDEARELVEHFDEEGSMSGLFPELYHKRIGNALARKAVSDASAVIEADRVAMATARTNMVERAYREAASEEDRHLEEKERLEIVERRLKRG